MQNSLERASRDQPKYCYGLDLRNTYVRGDCTKKNPLVGTWRLVSVTDTTDKGEVIKDAYGLNPAGLITYTADSRMMVIFTYYPQSPLLDGRQAGLRS